MRSAENVHRVSLAGNPANRHNDLGSEHFCGETHLEPKIRIVELANAGDIRGFSFTAPPEALAFLKRILDIHIASTSPGAVRGNHYHLRRREAIVVLPGSPWSFHWDEGDATLAQHRSFEGSSAVLILVSPHSSHAVRNDGSALLWLVACSSETYDAAESVTRKVV